MSKLTELLNYTKPTMNSVLGVKSKLEELLSPSTDNVEENQKLSPTRLYDEKLIEKQRGLVVGVKTPN